MQVYSDWALHFKEFAVDALHTVIENAIPVTWPANSDVSDSALKA